jgi:hypothetical protein
VSGEVGVAAALGDDEIVGLGVEVDDADVEALSIEEKPDLGVFGRRPAFVGFLLDERVEWLHRRPDRLVNEAVDRGPNAVGEAADGQLRNLANVLGRRKLRSDDTDRTEREQAPAYLHQHPDRYHCHASTSRDVADSHGRWVSIMNSSGEGKKEAAPCG